MKSYFLTFVRDQAMRIQESTEMDYPPTALLFKRIIGNRGKSKFGG
jgi:hypothetical protein